MAKIPPTDENLIKIAAKPIARWLIQAAKDRSSLSYGAAKERLERECGFSTIFSASMGKPCGALMDAILEKHPEAPLLNVLMVRSGDGYAGPGASGYMARRFGKPKLAKRGIRQSNKAFWRDHADQAAAEVYAYRDEWDRVFRDVFGEKWRPVQPPSGKEKDGGQCGGGGEGRNHKALRLWIKNNPEQVNARFAKFHAETEVRLESADRVDVVYYGKDETIAIEVKSKDSNYDDLRRGVFQCVKYRAVMKAMDVRQEPAVGAILVTQGPLPGDLKVILWQNDIDHFDASKYL